MKAIDFVKTCQHKPDTCEFYKKQKHITFLNNITWIQIFYLVFILLIKIKYLTLPSVDGWPTKRRHAEISTITQNRCTIS
jgi:hypothetical protein